MAQDSPAALQLAQVTPCSTVQLRAQQAMPHFTCFRLVVCSNDAAAARALMLPFNPLMSCDLGQEQVPQVLVDWWLMVHADVLVISNSSFAFAACMLNERSMCWSSGT